MRKLIIISAVLNFGLVLAVAYGWKAIKAEAVLSAPEEPGEPEALASNINSLLKPVPKTATGGETPVNSDFNWRDVESVDYKTYIENLRRIRCPESTIADIIIMDVNKFYRNRLAPLRTDNDMTVRFWENNNGSNRDSAYQKAWQEAEKEKSKLLKELLGMSYREEIAKASGWDMEPKDPFFKNLSKDQKDQMKEIQWKFNEIKSEVHRRTRGMQDEEDQAELKRIEKDQLAELAKIFSPEELFEYQLRSSQTVQNMKWNDLEGFNATEEEFRAIAKAKLFDNDPSESDPGERGKKKKEADDALKQALGEDRYKEFKLNSEWEYRNLKKLVEKNGGDQEIARQVYGMKDEIQKATRKIRDDKSLSKEERDKKLLTVREEVDKTLIEALGERGYKSFRNNAWWIREISNGIKQN